MLELRWLTRLEPGDLVKVRALPRRKWDRERRIWIVPDTEGALGALKRAFGPRLRLPPATPAASERIGRGANSDTSTPSPRAAEAPKAEVLAAEVLAAEAPAAEAP
ncbi:MAG: hypothetical protein WEB88_03270, partial [Gemmatimonadota bacterium]